MKKVVAQLQKGLPNSIIIERISGSMLRVLYSTRVFPYVEDENVKDIVASEGYGGYATADTNCAHGIITINFNTVYTWQYGVETYKSVVKNVLDYILSCREED